MKSEELRNKTDGVKSGTLCIINSDLIKRVYYRTNADAPGYEWYILVSEGKKTIKLYASGIKEIEWID